MGEPILNDISHRRFNLLRGSWVLVSPHRNKRPWQGLQEKPSRTSLPDYDPECYLCPGNTRANGSKNPKFTKTFVFVNDYSAVKEEQEEYHPAQNRSSLASRLLRVDPVTGKCYVICFSPSHHLTLADMTPVEIIPIIETWTNLYKAHLDPKSPLAGVAKALSLPPFSQGDIAAPNAQYRYMQIFENKGSTMGCSNPHPHGQIWTTTSLPEEPNMELQQLSKYRHDQNGCHLLVDYAKLESEQKERTVFENESFWAGVPYWAVWPFEVMIISRQHKRALVDFNDREREQLAEAIAEITRRYDNLFETQFPYSMGLHQAPLQGTEEEIESSHFHIHFYPPLLRSATVRKFQVGYEMLGEPQRDITPEQAAERLRACDGELYRKKLEHLTNGHAGNVTDVGHEQQKQ
ncbi:galactose-1-phosphate uridyl transferase [Paraconiothyrium brasiliense]|uniref:Galactose-1-phosphate uridylyltransferase n=1 Tax=Paraconiothyrium brasiliense TaxID=300254 RepID=A0ABR3R332_9PLEO